MKFIAYIENDYVDRFGIPRQSGLADVCAKIIFYPAYRNPDSLRGMESYTHVWLLWHFDLKRSDLEWTPTVRPPKLGGNRRMGVFATRSPNRPNPIGLSSVRLLSIKNDGENGMVLFVSGADLQNGTRIYDIKPYLPYTDCHPDAIDGFAQTKATLSVEFPEPLLCRVPLGKREPLYDILAQDPRPGYHTAEERIYHMPYGEQEISFVVRNGILVVTDVQNRVIGEK